MFQLKFSIFLITICMYLSAIESKTFTITNKCNYTVWPGIFPPLDNTTGFVLKRDESRNLTAPPSWSGRIWGRTGCYSDDRVFYCLTGDCRTGKIHCFGDPPYSIITLVELTLGLNSGIDYFDVSLVDGYNLPIRIVPHGENCTTIGCEVDINSICPPELRFKSEYGSQVVACKNACAAFRRPPYCCTANYLNVSSCRTSTYAQLFKGSCPQAYSYAYDDRRSTFSCASNHFEITFCPPNNNTRQTPTRDSSQGTENSTLPPSINGSDESNSENL